MSALSNNPPGANAPPGQTGILHRRAEILSRLLTILTTQPTLAGITTAVKHAVREGANADGVAFVLRDGDQCYYVDEDAMSPLWKGQRFPMASCVSGWAMTHRAAVIIPDVFADPRVPHEAYRQTFVKSMVMVPIRGVLPVGSIGAYWQVEHSADAGTVHWLQTVADALSPVMELTLAKEDPRHQSGATPPATGKGELIHLCAWTRRVLLDGIWVSFETFLKVRFGLQVTHTISPEAAEAMVQEVNRMVVPPKV